MKKLEFTVVIMLMAAMAAGQIRQTVKPGLKSVPPPNNQLIEKGPLNTAFLTLKNPVDRPVPKKSKSSDFVNIISIGTSGNAGGYGYAGGQRTLVWADQNLNTVTNFHRLGGVSMGSVSDMGYDISKDGGLNLENQILVCEAQGSGGYGENARYPNHCIFNPAGNTDPENAYVAFFAAMFNNESSTSLWGDYLHGRAKIGDQSDTTRTIIHSDITAGLYFDRMTGYTITQTGDIWVTDISMSTDPATYELTYFGNIIVSHGT